MNERYWINLLIAYIAWYTDNTPVNDVQVAAHFSSKRPILGICLKRYSVLPNGNAIRLNTFIDIPTEIGLPHFIQDDDLDEDGPLYGNFKLSLQSVVCHRGNSVDSGHYIALVRGAALHVPPGSPRPETNSIPSTENNDSWMRFDDLAAERVTQVNIEEALKEESPYLLFYQIVPIDDSLTEENLSDKRASYLSGSEDLTSDLEKEGFGSSLDPSSGKHVTPSARLSFDLSSLRPSTNPVESTTPLTGIKSATTDKEATQNVRNIREAFASRRSLSIPRRKDESTSRSGSRGRDQSGEKRLSGAFSRFTSRMSKEKGIENPLLDVDRLASGRDAEDVDNQNATRDETENKDLSKYHESTNIAKSGRKQSAKKKEKSNPDRECAVM